MSRAYEIDQAILADFVQFRNDWNWYPHGKAQVDPEFVWDPCTGTFYVEWGPPFPVHGEICEEEPLGDLTAVPVEAITTEALNAPVEKLTADPEPVGPILVAAAACQRLAEFHNDNGHPGAYELLDATAGQLFAEAISRMRTSR